MTKFDKSTWVGLLQKIADDPPSDRMLSTEMLNTIRAFLAGPERDDAGVWNFYKRLMDDAVHASGAAPSIMALLDLERFCDPPEGAYCQRDGSIDHAPWREERE